MAMAKIKAAMATRDTTRMKVVKMGDMLVMQVETQSCFQHDSYQSRALQGLISCKLEKSKRSGEGKVTSKALMLCPRRAKDKTWALESHQQWDCKAPERPWL